MSAESTTRSVAGPAAQGALPPVAQPPRAPKESGSTSRLALTQTVAAPASLALVRAQWIVAGALALLLLFVALRLWLVAGLVRTARIDGPSMAPAWCGAHYRVTCDDCGLTFVCDAARLSADELAVCPNCGFKDNRLPGENLVLGQQVLVDRWPLVLRSPQRGEVVAAADSEHPGEFLVKRVAGLPGERLAIRGGDLYADDRLVRKSLRELSAVRVLVHDNRRQPQRTGGLPERWQSDQPRTGWHAAIGGYRYEPPSPAPAAGRLDWLQYYHWLMFASHSRTRLAPVLDTDSYNQADAREQNAVPDVLLSCRLRGKGLGRFGLAAIDGQRFEALFDPGAKSVTLTRNGRAVAQERLATRFAGRGELVEFGLCDQQVLLSVAGREVFRQPYDRPSGPRPEPLHPLAIGADGMVLEVADLCVWRDLYYLAPGGLPGDWQAREPLPPGSYALLGDNTTVSIDSRQWSGGVPANQVLGVVYEPFWRSERE